MICDFGIEWDAGQVGVVVGLTGARRRGIAGRLAGVCGGGLCGRSGGWRSGVATTAIKNLAESRRLDHNGHSVLRGILRQLAEETGDEELSENFGPAETLHINFDKGRLPEEDVKRYIDHVERLEGKPCDLGSVSR